MNQYVSVILAASVPLFIIVIGIICSFLSSAINKAVVYLKSKTDNEMLDYALDAAQEVVTNTVKALNQTVVNDLKDAAEDGKLTTEEITNISNVALETVQLTLSAEVKAILEKAYGDVNLYLSNLIESTVNDAKHELIIGGVKVK